MNVNIKLIVHGFFNSVLAESVYQGGLQMMKILTALVQSCSFECVYDYYKEWMAQRKFLFRDSGVCLIVSGVEGTSTSLTTFYLTMSAFYIISGHHMPKQILVGFSNASSI